MTNTNPRARGFDITAAREARDASLSNIVPMPLAGATDEQVAAWRRAQVSVEASFEPYVADLCDKLLAVLKSAIADGRMIAIERPRATPDLVSFKAHDAVLDRRGVTFGDVTIPLHEVQPGAGEPVRLWTAQGGLMLHAPTHGQSAALHAELRERLARWRATDETLLLCIDGETTTIGSSQLHAYGLSLSLRGDPMDLGDISVIADQHGPDKYALGQDLRIVTASGTRIDIAPLSELDLSVQEDIDTASRFVNADFFSIYRPMATERDLGRQAVALPGVKRIVVTTADLAPMQRAYEKWDPSTPLPEYERPVVTILDWTPDAPVNVLDVTRAAWSAYILSLKASEDLGLNDRCHVSPPLLAESAATHVALIGAVSTPHDCVYGSSACYWELSQIEFDAADGTLTISPQMGS